ncbi:MAG: hypothetical protein QGG74_06750 [Phycisphaerales bacterium]|nr:hypothetical protein [Phycisphaerales bacterium]
MFSSTVVILLVAAAAFAGDVRAPGNLSSLSKKDLLSSTDEEAVAAFVDLHASRLRDGDATERPKARAKLLADVYGISGRRATPLFRELYAAQLIPKLKAIMTTSDTPQRIAAAQVAGGLGTDSAVNFLIRHVEPAQQPTDAVRLWTAASMRPLIAHANVTPSRLNQSIETLGRAAMAEPGWPVLRQQLETIAAAMSNQRGEDGGQADLMGIALAQQSAVLLKVVERLKGGDLDMVLVLEPHMQHIQQQFLDQGDPDTLRALSLKTVPALSGLYDAILTNWDAIRKDQRIAQIAGRTLEKTEVMIVLMDNFLTDQSNATAPEYEGALLGNNRAAIEAGKAKWGGIAEGRIYQ